MRIALIGYGEVGRILAEDLRARGESVTAFDLKLESEAGAALRRHAAEHAVTLSGTFAEDDVDLSYASVFKNVSYDIDSQAGTARDILRDVMKKIPTINLQAAVQGTFPKLAINASSNLGTELKKGVELQIQERKKRAPQTPDDEIRRQSLADLCQTLFSLNEFLYVD